MSAVIEINGQAYDAFSGRPVEGADRLAPRNIDGILGAKEAPAYLEAAAQFEPHPLEQVVSRPTLQDVVRHTPNGVKAHRPKTAQTLMRHAVQKPSKPLSRLLHVQSNLDPQLTSTGESPLRLKVSVNSVSPQRLARSQKAVKSQSVSRFAVLPAVSPAIVIAVEPALQWSPQPKPHSSMPGLPSLLDQAVQRAASHQQSPPAKNRRLTKRAAVLSVSFAAFLIVVGSVAAGSFSSLKMYVAGSRAGFSAGLPSYQPAGYHLQGVNYSPGVVASDFLSNSDQRDYTLTEKVSNWDNAALLANYVQQNATTYQSAESNGRTVYLYGNHQATWVWHGVWYQLESNGSLSNHQLVQIAGSIS